MKKYYMVHNPGSTPPANVHETIELAVTEAKRLASKITGKTFVVLEAVDAYKVESPAPTQLRMEN